MTILKWYNLPILLLALVSCSLVEEKSVTQSNEILIENSGFFRGYQLGWPPDSLFANEKWAPSISNDSIIEYHQEVWVIQDTAHLDAYLAFDAYGLFEIQVDLFIKNDSVSQAILEDWSARLNEPFGNSELLLNSKRWTTVSEANNTVEITLSQERNDERQTFISLNYLEPLDDEY